MKLIQQILFQQKARVLQDCYLYKICRCDLHSMSLKFITVTWNYYWNGVQTIIKGRSSLHLSLAVKISRGKGNSPCSICVRYKDSDQISSFPSYQGIMHLNFETWRTSWDKLRKEHIESIFDSSLGRYSRHSHQILLGCFWGVYLRFYVSLKGREGFLPPAIVETSSMPIAPFEC